MGLGKGYRGAGGWRAEVGGASGDGFDYFPRTIPRANFRRGHGGLGFALAERVGIRFKVGLGGEALAASDLLFLLGAWWEHGMEMASGGFGRISWSWLR